MAIFRPVFRTGEGLRQDPLGLSFWSFLTFLHHNIEDIEHGFYADRAAGH